MYFAEASQIFKGGVEKNCQDCAKKFNILLREHQYKRCLKLYALIAENLSILPLTAALSENNNIVSANPAKTHRITLSLSSKYNNLKFGEMSDFGKDWVKRITQKPPNYGTDNSQHKIFRN